MVPSFEAAVLHPVPVAAPLQPQKLYRAFTVLSVCPLVLQREPLAKQPTAIPVRPVLPVPVVVLLAITLYSTVTAFP
jgi:hypothetical protein